MYYARYVLTVRHVQSREQFQKLQGALMEQELIDYVFDFGHFYQDDEEAVFDPVAFQIWIDSNERLSLLSVLFPDMVFELWVMKEDGEQWKNYYQNGKIEFCPGIVKFEKPSLIQWKQYEKF